MSAVYRARDTRLEREVALKVLPEAVSQDPDRLARFECEARAVGLCGRKKSEKWRPAAFRSLV